MVVCRYSFAFFTDFILRVYFNICDLQRISLSAAACLITWCMSQGVEEAWKKRSFMGAVQSLQHFLKFCLKFVGLAFAHCFILNPERKKKCLTCLGITSILILHWLSENCLTFDLGSTPALTMLSIPLWHCVYSSYFICSKYVGALH